MNIYHHDDIPDDLRGFFKPVPQLGLEPTPEEYVAELVAIFREVRRVLRSDGTCWLNLGDSYCNTDKWGGGGPNIGKHTVTDDGTAPSWTVRRRKEPFGLKPKDLVGIPWRVAFALQADGWWLRSDIIWAKKNGMPESVNDRPTRSHEYLFLLTKAERYFYDADAIAEPIAEVTAADRVDTGRFSPDRGYPGARDHGNGRLGSSPRRNKRSVWWLATQPFSEAHFATLPPDLVKPCVLAGTSERGACSVCGAPWERVVERTSDEAGREPRGKALTSPRNDGLTWNENGGREFMPVAVSTLRWRPICAHASAPTVPCTVLDPFAGAGTTLYVAKELGRHYIGIELNPEYVDMATRRLRQEVLFR